MKVLKKILLTVTLVLLVTALASCAIFDLLGGGNGKDTTLSVDSVYAMALEEGYSGSLEDFIAEFKGERGADGAKGEEGKEGVGIADATFDSDNHLILTLTNGKEIDCGSISVNVSVETGISVGENGHWYIDGEDTGHSAVGKDGATWLTGVGAPNVTLGNIGDLYLDTASSDIYRKDNEDTWVLIANIQGEGVTVIEGDEYNVTVNGVNGSVAAASKALMSAVRVNATFRENTYSYDSYIAGGAGVIYSLDKSAGNAYIITNYHVIYEKSSYNDNGMADEISLFLYGLEYSDYAIEATVLGGSMTYDIAVLEVKDSAVLRESGAMAVEVASSADVKVLDTAIAIGNAESNGLSATLGAVSVVSEVIEMSAQDGSGMVDHRVMRVDTAVNHGNSGGGLFDASGRLIGIVNAKEVGEDIDNMGYAIPSDLAIAVAENIIRNCDGSTAMQVIKPLVGIQVINDDISVSYDQSDGTVKRKVTVAVYEVSTTGLAYGHLLAGDIISSIELNGVTYSPGDSTMIAEILLYASVGDDITFNVVRDGTPTAVTFNLEASAFSAVK